MYFTIVTRSSPLALQQTGYCCSALKKHAISYDVMTRTTEPDRHLNRPLSAFSKPSFTKELESALLTGEADFAVHSAKDVGVNQPDGLELVATLPRASVEDVLISKKVIDWRKLKTIGCSSIRRQHQLKRIIPDVQFIPIRGNIARRLQWLDREDTSAVCLARAGLQRLHLENDYSLFALPLDQCVPAPGQGAIVVQMRVDHPKKQQIISAINHLETWNAITLERKWVDLLGGSCQMPLGIHVFHSEKGVHGRVQLFGPDERYCFIEKTASCMEELNVLVATDIMSQEAHKWYT